MLIECSKINLKVLEACVILQYNNSDMTDLILLQEENSKKVVEDLLVSETGQSRFKKLLQNAKLEKELLQISSYENAEFILNQNSIKQNDQVQVDRLVLVYPPTFAFSVVCQINGHFNVKYNSVNNVIPVQVKPFNVNYTGILIQHKSSFEIKNERIILKER